MEWRFRQAFQELPRRGCAAPESTGVSSFLGFSSTEAASSLSEDPTSARTEELSFAADSERFHWWMIHFQSYVEMRVVAVGVVVAAPSSLQCWVEW